MNHLISLNQKGPIWFRLMFSSCILFSSVLTAQDCTKGDVNLDGNVNFADVLHFQNVLLSGSYQCEADGNYDGVIDLLDAAPILVELLDQQDEDFLDSTVVGPGDFFWSTSPLGFGAKNGPLNQEMYAGDTETFYLYYTIDGAAGEVNIGAALNVMTSVDNVIQFTDAGTYNFYLEFMDIQIEERWRSPNNFDQTDYQAALSIEDEMIIGMTSGSSLVSHGMTEFSSNGDPFLDAGFSIPANAFLFGKLEFTAIGPGTVELIAGPNELGIANNEFLVDVAIAAASIHVILIGDVNLDEEVDLSDVPAFIDRLTSGTYQAEADCNYDGALNLFDVQPFVDILLGN